MAVAIYALLGILVLYAVFTAYIAYRINHKKHKPDYPMNEFRDKRHDEGFVDDIRKWISEAEYDYLSIESPHGYPISVFRMTNPLSNKWMFIIHGVSENHKKMMDIAYMYWKMGFSIFAWDSRHHGASGGRNISYGYYEKDDLDAVLKHLKGMVGEETPIGLHGESMGGGIALSYLAAYDPLCDFSIIDCPYDNFYVQASDVVSRMLRFPRKLVGILMRPADIYCRLFYGFGYSDIELNAGIGKLRLPVLFVTCSDDAYINPGMTERLYGNCGSSLKRFVLFEEGGHAGAYALNRAEYEWNISEFIKIAEERVK